MKTTERTTTKFIYDIEGRIVEEQVIREYEEKGECCNDDE